MALTSEDMRTSEMSVDRTTEGSRLQTLMKFRTFPARVEDDADEGIGRRVLGDVEECLRVKAGVDAL